LTRVVRQASWPIVRVYTEEWQGYDRLPEIGRAHATACYAKHEWARDEDGDGVREVQNNTLEGLWTGLRNFLVRSVEQSRSTCISMWRFSSGLQREAGDDRVPPCTLGRTMPHQVPDMSLRVPG
jgi:hypothetical protein